MPSDALANVIALLRAAPVPADIDLAQLRQNYVALGAMMPAADGVAVEETELAGRPAWRAVPPSAHPTRTVLYLHGGGYVIGSPASHGALVTHLAAAAGATVWALDYRLAPEHPYPAALDDAVAAVRALLEAGVPAGSLTIAGDSAGGGLTLAAVLRLRDEGGPLPAGAVLLSPWLDLTHSGDSIREREALDPMVSPAMLDRWADEYTAAGRAADPATSPGVSPLVGDLAGLPPLLVHVGTEEILLDDARRLAGRVDAVGGDIDLHVGEGLIHVWHLFVGVVPEADEAVAAVGTWIADRTS